MVTISPQTNPGSVEVFDEKTRWKKTCSFTNWPARDAVALKQGRKVMFIGPQRNKPSAPRTSDRRELDNAAGPPQFGHPTAYLQNQPHIPSQ